MRSVNRTLPGRMTALVSGFLIDERKGLIMLEETLKTQLAAYLERVSLPIELVASLDDHSGFAP
jgi:hypothetical protein